MPPPGVLEGVAVCAAAPVVWGGDLSCILGGGGPSCSGVHFLSRETHAAKEGSNPPRLAPVGTPEWCEACEHRLPPAPRFPRPPCVV